MSVTANDAEDRKCSSNGTQSYALHVLWDRNGAGPLLGSHVGPGPFMRPHRLNKRRNTQKGLKNMLLVVIHITRRLWKFFLLEGCVFERPDLSGLAG